MEVTITDVTRMREPSVCVAGVSGDRTVRLSDPQPNDMCLKSLGGLVPGDVISLSLLPIKGATPPHKEDSEWSSVSRLGRLTEAELVEILRPRAYDSVIDALGRPSALGSGGNGGFPPRRGSRSLASIIVESVKVYPHFEGIRVDFTDRRGSWTRVPFQDLLVRTHQRSCSVCRAGLAGVLARELCGGGALLRVGLSRPFSTPQHPPLCWLQVNHIFLTPSRRKHFV